MINYLPYCYSAAARCHLGLLQGTYAHTRIATRALLARALEHENRTAYFKRHSRRAHFYITNIFRGTDDTHKRLPAKYISALSK